ncbi:MAG: DMT family transporter [Pseudohongiellaceae bacterium]
MNARALSLLALLASIWGSSFLFIRLAVDDFGVVPLTASRSLIAAVTLTPLALLKGKGALLRENAWHLFVLGLISTALPFCFLSISTRYTSAGFASILNAFTPICSALIAWSWLREQLSLPALLGIGVSFLGLLVMVGSPELLAADYGLLPVAVGIGATLLYGLTGIYSRKFVPHLPPLVVSAGCQIAAAAALLPLALLQWPAAPIAASSWLIAAVLGIVCTGTAYIIYFHLLATVGVTRTVIVTYLSPVFAMLWGVLFIDETVTWRMLVGAAGIMAGIALTSYRPGPRAAA